MDGDSNIVADPPGLAPDEITRETRRRFCRLPAEVTKRAEQARQEKQRQCKAKRLLHMKTVYWKKHDRLTVTLSPPQAACLTAQAQQTGCSRTALLREAAFAWFDRCEGERGESGHSGAATAAECEPKRLPATPAPPSAPSPAAKGDPEIRRLGTLLNQIARHANRNHSASQRELAACREIFTRIETHLAARGGSSPARQPASGGQPTQEQQPGSPAAARGR